MLFAGLLLGFCIHWGFSTNGRGAELLVKDNASLLCRVGDKMVSSRTERKGITKTKGVSLDKEESYFLQLSKMDAEEAQTEIDRIRNKTKSFLERSTNEELALSFLYSRLGEKAPRQGLEQIKQNPEYFFYNKHILLAWVEKNPEAAMNYCLENKDPKFGYGYAEVIARVSPEKSLEWIKALPQKKQNEALDGLFMGAFKSHPEKIGELIQKAGELASFDSSLKNSIAEMWIVADKAATMKWIDSLSEEEQIEARASALKELPLEEATIAMASLEDEAKEAALIQIARSLGTEFPSKAMEWLMIHSDSDLERWQSIVDSLYFSNSQFIEPTFKSYLAKMPTGDKKDIFMEKMIERLRYPNSDLGKVDRAEVLSFTSQIGNVEKRILSIERAIEPWAIESPDEARQWIDNADLPQEKKKQLRETCDRSTKRRKMFSE